MSIFTQVIEAEWQADGRTVKGEIVETANAKASFDEVIADSETNKEFVLSFDVITNKLKSLFILSSKDVTLKTNDSGSPDDEIALKAGVPLPWAYQAGNYYHACPLTADVAKIFVTNASGGIARLQIEALYDSTAP